MNIGLKKRQIISQPGLATCLGPALESCSYLINWLFGLLTIFPPTVRHTFSSCVLSAYLPRKTENYLYIKYVNTYRHNKRDNEALFTFHYTTTFKNLLFRRALFHDTLKCGYISTSNMVESAIGARCSPRRALTVIGNQTQSPYSLLQRKEKKKENSSKKWGRRCYVYSSDFKAVFPPSREANTRIIR